MTLYMFYGTECVHCHEMEPFIDRLEKEEKIIFTKLETWHNSANAKKLQGFDCGKCGAVPFFYNDETKKFICGATNFEALKKLALGN